MARLNDDNLVRARELIALYPVTRSALIPVLHLLQEQDGYLSPDGIVHVAELFELTAAEVRGTASFYDMFFLKPVGRYVVAVCTNIACMLAGSYELLDHIEKRLGVSTGGTTPDGSFTLEDAECLALCGNAPCLTVNWRYFGDMTPGRWETLAEDLLAGRLDDEVPPHGTLCRVRRAVGLPASAPATSAGASTGRSAPSKAPGEGGAKRQAPAALDNSGHLDHAGREVQLATSRSTPAVGSTLAPGGSPRGRTGEREATGGEAR
ncbi:MAG TPA: NAD(P)H-dependent oxidoreductase subunit E [Acidimicrobiales bacterium]|nr:NAD(P)H-dependent oxidoreductase subunit E [Acidimicrobiales bacterium]